MSTVSDRDAPDIPARLDRLPWSRFHVRLVVALGACWVLDGYEITVASNIGVQLADPHSLALSPFAVVALGCVYLLGQVVGALYFGYRSDRSGRRRLFFRTLAIYMAGSFASACIPGSGLAAVALLFLARFVAGLGIGGEYAAINSTIDELVPARYRGRVDITVNGTYWAGATVAALIQIPLLSGRIDASVDWRLPLLLGPVLALGIWFVRRNIPESPRWLVAHGRHRDADEVVRRIERAAGCSDRAPADAHNGSAAHDTESYHHLVGLLRCAFRPQVRLCATLMIAQSVLYNSIFFTFSVSLVRLHGVDPDTTAWYLVPFVLANLAGPLVLAHWFDVVGRRTMISRTYAMAGVLLAVGAVLLGQGALNAPAEVTVLAVTFFFASAGASSAYLTVTELYPVHVRAKATAVFLAMAQGCGLVATLLYGLVVDLGDPTVILASLLAGAAAMLVAGAVAYRLAVDAENKPLEEVATLRPQ